MSRSLKSIRSRGLVVGITVGTLAEFAALFANGIGQNALYLALLLQRVPSVRRVVLFTVAGEADMSWLTRAFGVEVRAHTDGILDVDVLIELGWRVDSATVGALHSRGSKFVAYVGGNQFVMNLEAVACRLPRAEQMTTNQFDAIWMTPQHWRTNLSYLLLTRSGAVFRVPHIWSPVCLNASVAARQDGGHYKPFGRAKNGGRRIGVFDPNVNVVKTFHLPALVAEAAYRIDPARVGAVLLFNTQHLVEYPHFKELVNALDVFKAGRLTAEARFPIAQMLGTHVDVIVTHQWENELNYLYYDALYLGYPLVHNSEALKDAGYYFPSFDAHRGGEVLVRALREHDDTLTGYRRAAHMACWRANIENPELVDTHERLLWCLYDDRVESPVQRATLDSYEI